MTAAPSIFVERGRAGRQSDGWRLVWRGGIASVRFRCDGHRHQITTGARTEPEASVAAQAIYERVLMAAWLDASPPIWPWPSVRGIYFVARGVEVKIGRATDIARRLESLQTGGALPLKLLAVAAGGETEERALHFRYRHTRIRGEWFRLSVDLVDGIQHLREAQALLARRRRTA